MLAPFQYHKDGIGDVAPYNGKMSEVEHIYGSMYDLATSIHSFLKELRADKSIDDGAKMFIQANILSFQEKEALFKSCPTTDRNYVSHSNALIDGSVLNLQYIYHFVSDTSISDSESIDRILFLLNMSKSYYYVFYSSFGWELDFYVPIEEINNFFKKKPSKWYFYSNFMYSSGKYPVIVSKTTSPAIPLSFIKSVCTETADHLEYTQKYYDPIFLWDSIKDRKRAKNRSILNYMDISKSFKQATNHLDAVFTPEQKNTILSSDPKKNEVKIPTENGFGIYYKDSGVWVPDAYASFKGNIS